MLGHSRSASTCVSSNLCTFTQNFTEEVAEVQEKLLRPELWNDVALDYNRAWLYNKRLGFHVAIDAAARLPRSLPVAAVFSLAPPGQPHLLPPYMQVLTPFHPHVQSLHPSSPLSYTPSVRLYALHPGHHNACVQYIGTLFMYGVVQFSFWWPLSITNQKLCCIGLRVLLLRPAPGRDSWGDPAV